MISNLKIKNFVLIDDVEISFDTGLNIITGETGAGKSIVIDAIDIVLGARASKDQIKTGTEKAFIEITLKLDDDFNAEMLVENGIELENNELIISREINANATRSRINGVLVTQNFVQDLRENLIDIHSQNETYNCLRAKTHINLLDNYGDAEHRNLLNSFTNNYKQYRQLKQELDRIISLNQEIEQKKDFLEFQINEIEAAAVEDTNEDESLAQKREVLVNAEELKAQTYSNYEVLYGQENSIIDVLGSVESAVIKASKYDKALSEIAEIIASSKISLKEAAQELRNYSENLDVDAETLDSIEQRIEMLDKIKRKYGRTLEDVLANFEKFQNELNEIQFSSEKAEVLQKQVDELSGVIEKQAQELSNSRKELGKKLSALIQDEIHKLEMPQALFTVNITSLEKIQLNGQDSVEFLISANAGEEPKPLAKIASGGEISRVMLALKTVFAQADNVNTVIFDEIDSGISGKASQAVAEELVRLSRHHQILCITHQPIIAAMADRYFHIEKTQSAVSTNVSVEILEDRAKIEAVARLASGNTDVEAINFATTLVNQAKSHR